MAFVSKNKNNTLVFLQLFTIIFFSFYGIAGHSQKNNSRDLSYLTSGGKLLPLQAIMDIRHYAIVLDIDIQRKTIKGYAEISLNLSEKTDTILLDLIHLYTVTKIKVNNTAVLFTQNDDKIFITAVPGFKPGNQRVHIEYNGIPPVAVRPPWNGGFTWTKDVNGNDWVALNIQAEGGKMYFPCKDHPSDEPNEGVDMKITVPAGLVVAGPGLLQQVSTKNNKTTYYWKTKYTISNYCVVFNIGKYKTVKDIYTTIDGHAVPVEYYVLEADTMHAKKVIATRIRDTKMLEKYFGEYPWVKEKIGIAEVPNPGMEHQTMITFDNKFVYVKVGPYDYSDNLFHEFAHEWWANKVTNKDWAHMWIQEGIATYAEALAMLELGGEAAYNKIIDGHRRGIRNRKAMVPGDEATEAEVYSGGDIYGKGSFFMHSLRYVTGDSIFFPALKKLATDPKYTYDNFVTTADVESLFSKASGRDLKPFFDFYLKTTNKIEVNVKEVSYQKYQLKITNFFMPLPFDLTINDTISRIIIPAEGIVVNSILPPQVDAKGFYLKRVTIE